MKKLLCLFFILCLFGCASDEILVKSGNSKTYAFFKNFDMNHYYVSFFDRNSTESDDTKIVMARDGDKYYYEVTSMNRQKIIQKDGFKYTILDNGYYMEKSEVYDYSHGILPDISKIKDSKFKTGYKKLFGIRYLFEEYTVDKEAMTYFFKGDKLVYINYSSPLQELLLKFDKFGDVDSKIFEIDDDLLLLSY